jgi:hypothetical protein
MTSPPVALLGGVPQAHSEGPVTSPIEGRLGPVERRAVCAQAGERGRPTTATTPSIASWFWPG